jgi:hypothetical protein
MVPSGWCCSAGVPRNTQIQTLLNDDMNSVGALQCNAPTTNLGIIRLYLYSATSRPNSLVVLQNLTY